LPQDPASHSTLARDDECGSTALHFHTIQKGREHLESLLLIKTMKVDPARDRDLAAPNLLLVRALCGHDCRTLVDDRSCGRSRFRLGRLNGIDDRRIFHLRWGGVDDRF
jgi:hypothetical protein